MLFLPFIGYSNYRVYTQLGVNMYSLLILVTAVSTAGLAGGRRLVRSIEGPTVDPGVFVITHIRYVCRLLNGLSMMSMILSMCHH